jgi:hypothetical protein
MRTSTGVATSVLAFLGAAACLASAGLAPAPVASPPLVLVQGRLRPPALVTCDRNHLTSFTGKVVSLERSSASTTIRMETDEGTKETFALRHPGADATAWFFLAGKPFTPADWAALLPGGTLRAGARATVWVCSDEPNPRVDWAPSARP